MEACGCQALCWALGAVMNGVLSAPGEALLGGREPWQKLFSQGTGTQQDTAWSGPCEALPVWVHSVFSPLPLSLFPDTLCVLINLPLSSFSLPSGVAFPACLVGSARAPFRDQLPVPLLPLQESFLDSLHALFI